MAGAGVAGTFAARGTVLPILRTTLADASEPVRSGALILMMGGIFVCALTGLFLGVHWLHGRPIRSLVTTAPRLRIGQLLLGLILSAGLVGISAYALDPGSLKPLSGVSLTGLSVSFLAMLVGFSIQAPAEEIIFRGYILQVAMRGFRSVWAAAGLSVLLFTLAHFGYGIETALSSLTFAVGMTVIVVLLGGLELAMGAHIGNNLIIALLFQDVLDANTPSASGIAWDELAVEAGIMLVLIIVATLIRFSSRPARSVQQ
jgi:membrane protease YdiL (CAAX protease family)